MDLIPRLPHIFISSEKRFPFARFRFPRRVIYFKPIIASLKVHRCRCLATWTNLATGYMPLISFAFLLSTGIPIKRFSRNSYVIPMACAVCARLLDVLLGDSCASPTIFRERCLIARRAQ